MSGGGKKRTGSSRPGLCSAPRAAGGGPGGARRRSASQRRLRPSRWRRVCLRLRGGSPSPYSPPPGRPRRRENGGLGGSGLGGGGNSRLEQPGARRGVGGQRKACPRRGSSFGCGICLRFGLRFGFGVVARGGRWRGTGASGALRRVPGAPAARTGATLAALFALGLQRLPRTAGALLRQQRGGRWGGGRWCR